MQGALPAGALVVPKVGATLGRYQILSTLGHGAMATVFRAKDTQLGREVAIKVMSLLHAGRGGASERFRREARAVATLKHPGIVEIHDFVDATEEMPSHIVVELIRGPTLRALLEQRGGRLLPEIAALIALPLAEALAAAHAKGIIHRDVKPDNVMIDTSGEGSRVVLTDFGVAHMTGMETMTATGALVGSPAYMSPEQSRGHEIGPTADLWSLGAMLYEMVTGVVPFLGKDPFTMIAAILRGSYRRPSQVVATVGADFEAMVVRCLRPGPSERYPHAGQLAEELRAFLRDTGLGADGTSLRRFLDHPDDLLAELKPRVADAAVARARRYARHGQLARALSELGHATAYVPNHPGADRLLRRLSASRALIKTVVALAVLALLVGLGLAARSFWKAKLAERIPPVAPAPSETSTPSDPETPNAPNPAGRALPAGDNGPAPARAQAIKSRPSRRSRQASTELAHASEPAPTGKNEPTPTMDVEPPPMVASPKESALPRKGTIALFAKGGFCYPTLDDQPVGGLMPVFHDVAPGKHRIYCSRTQQSPKEFVGEVDLAPGARIERTVTEQSGRLTIARPK